MITKGRGDSIRRFLAFSERKNRIGMSVSIRICLISRFCETLFGIFVFEVNDIYTIIAKKNVEKNFVIRFECHKSPGI